MKNTNLIIILITALVILGFWDLTKTFYQQDEWYGLGDILALGENAIFAFTDPLKIALGEGRVLADALVFFLLGKFPFNIVPIAIFAMVFHAINTALVFLLAKKFTKNIPVAVFSALFFAVNSAASGSVIWAASGTGTLPATTFLILSLFSFFRFLAGNEKKFLFLAFLFIYFSLFFKEIGIFLFLFLPFIALIFKKYSIRNFLSTYWPFFAFSVVAVVFRIIEFQSIPVEKDLFITGASQDSFLTLTVRAIIYPLTSFSLIYFPPQHLFDFAKHLTWIYYSFLPPELYDLVAQTTVLDGLAAFLTVLFLFILFILFKNSPTQTKKLVLFLIIFITASFLPYIVIGKSFAYLESRYYYLAAVGAGILISLALDRTSRLLKGTINFLIALFILILFVHFTAVKGDIERQKILAQERKAVLNQIMAIKPRLGDKNIFYMSGDRNYYITEGNPVPFQGGMGYTLLVWYYGNDKAPRELIPLINEQFLWELNGQGYKEVDGVGFGYFWDRGEFSRFVKETKVDGKNIVGLYYDSKAKKLIDITAEVIHKL